MAKGSRKRVPAEWRNRIVGSGEEAPDQLVANPRNWRIHPGRQRDAIRDALAEVGWVQQVIVNRRTGNLIDGHLRVEEALTAEAPTVPVLYVDLSEEEEAVVLATLDPLGAMAGTSAERLSALLSEVSVEGAGLHALLAKLGKDWGDAYTGTVKVPRYEPTTEAPPGIEELWDDTKAEALREQIRATPDLDPRLRDFLLAAAGRHTVFHYGRIADLYAHAHPAVQRLIEASALVIIDYEDAIRDGYVRFAEAVAALAEEEREDAA